jgi:hypothetical protein
MFVEAQAKASFGQHAAQRGLADLKRIAPQVVAIEFDEVKGVEEYALVRAVVTDDFLVSRSRNFAEEMKDTNYDPPSRPGRATGAPQPAELRHSMRRTRAERGAPRPVVAAEVAMPAPSGPALAQHRA